MAGEVDDAREGRRTFKVGTLNVEGSVEWPTSWRAGEELRC